MAFYGAQYQRTETGIVPGTPANTAPANFSYSAGEITIVSLQRTRVMEPSDPVLSLAM